MRTICRSARLNDRSLDHSFVDQISLQLLSSAGPTLQPSDAGSRQRHKQNLRSSTCFHHVHNGSAQLSYFIYSCTVRARSSTHRNSSSPSRALQSKPKRALHPIHNVKQPKNKRRLTPPTHSQCPSFSRSQWRTGGAERDRTDDLLLAKQALSQLSYGPNQLATLLDRSRAHPRALSIDGRRSMLSASRPSRATAPIR